MPWSLNSANFPKTLEKPFGMTYLYSNQKSNKSPKIKSTSDHHFGAPTKAASKPREERFISWLDHIKQDADVLFILGDLFDFWFEYKYVIPKGFTRVLGKLAELSDQGIEIHFFVGNHDLWDDVLILKPKIK